MTPQYKACTFYVFVTAANRDVNLLHLLEYKLRIFPQNLRL
jgi:hypothetical protein